MLVFSLSSFSQKIKTCEIDRFTKKVVVETKEQYLAKKMNPGNVDKGLKFSIRYSENKITMPALIQMSQSFKIDENSSVMFLMDDDSTITLSNAYTGVSSIGRGFAPCEFGTCLTMSDEDVQNFMNKNVVAIRMYYLGGHEDLDVSSSNKDVIKKALLLVYQTVETKYPNLK